MLQRPDRSIVVAAATTARVVHLADVVDDAADAPRALLPGGAEVDLVLRRTDAVGDIAIAVGAHIIDRLAAFGTFELQDVAPLQVQLQLARADLEGLADVGVDTADARGTGIHVAGVDGQDGAAVGHAIEVIAVTQHVAGKEGVGGVALDDLVGALDLPCVDGHRGGRGRLQHQADRVALGLFRLQQLVRLGDDRHRIGTALARCAATDLATHRIDRGGEGGQATIAVLGRVRRAEAFGVAGAQGDPVGRGPLHAQLRRGLAFTALVLVVTQRAGQFQLLQYRCGQFDVAGVDVLGAVIGRIAQADDVALVGVGLRGQAVAGLAPLGTDRQAQRATLEVHQAARHGEVEHVQARLGTRADLRRDVVVQRLRVLARIVTDAPHATGAVRIAQCALHGAVAQEAGALVGQVGA
ncbi:hypothetical protein G6F68_010258 [Rhizopus microsporus]|nr:hypothetical protein G6F68_010258 [Rhizopus microsporus]